MKQFAIDASVVLSWAQGGDKKIDPIWILQDKLAIGEISIIAPSFLLIEVANVLKWRFKASQADTMHFLSLLPKLPIRFIDSASGDIGETVTLEYKHQLSAYDALYLGLALVMDCTLISLDKRLLAVKGYVTSPAQVIKEMSVK